MEVAYHFPFVSFLDANEMVGIAKVQLSEDLGSLKEFGCGRYE